MCRKLEKAIMYLKRKAKGFGRKTYPLLAPPKAVSGSIRTPICTPSTKMHQNNDVFTFDHQTLNSTFKIINITGAGKWWPEDGEDSLNAARWNEYQCRKLVKVTLSVTDWRIYMERQMKRTLPASSKFY